MAKVKSENAGPTTKIVWHMCKHEYQDAKYGEQRRVANITKKAGVYRCTVCGMIV